jgi:hypothetical protein
VAPAREEVGRHHDGAAAGRAALACATGGNRGRAGGWVFGLRPLADSHEDVRRLLAPRNPTTRIHGCMLHAPNCAATPPMACSMVGSASSMCATSTTAAPVVRLYSSTNSNSMSLDSALREPWSTMTTPVVAAALSLLFPETDAAAVGARVLDGRRRAVATHARPEQEAPMLLLQEVDTRCMVVPRRML